MLKTLLTKFVHNARLLPKRVATTISVMKQMHLTWKINCFVLREREL